MSKNISKLSGRKGLKDNLFKRMIGTAAKSKNGKEIKLCHSGNWDEAKKLHAKVKKVRLLFQDYAPIPAQKAILAMQTKNDLWNNLRPPLQSISSEKANDLATTLVNDFEFSI